MFGDIVMEITFKKMHFYETLFILYSEAVEDNFCGWRLSFALFGVAAY